jgi:hypothetical protein
MRNKLAIYSVVIVALIAASACESNAERDATSERSSAQVEAAPVSNTAAASNADPTLPTAPTKNETPSLAIKPARADCDTLKSAAATHGIPLEFFTRLIRQESNFDPKSISRAGAQGIAQFMPGTARWRGLADPFEPTEALFESARWLHELRDQFGNLGLAAAAYNAGPRRVKNWIAGRGPLPRETRAYVRIITGKSAEEWVGSTDVIHPDQSAAGCTLATRTAAKVDRAVSTQDSTSNWAPWGLQLISDASETKALAEYKQLQKRYHAVLGDREPLVIKRQLGGRGASTWYFVRVAESTQQRANQLCSRLSSIGGSCLVSRN